MGFDTESTCVPKIFPFKTIWHRNQTPISTLNVDFYNMAFIPDFSIKVG